MEVVDDDQHARQGPRRGGGARNSRFLARCKFGQLAGHRVARTGLGLGGAAGPVGGLNGVVAGAERGEVLECRDVGGVAAHSAEQESLGLLRATLGVRDHAEVVERLHLVLDPGGGIGQAL